LNVADGFATPLAQAAYRQYMQVLGGKPVHHTLAYHWARAIELLYAAERMKELADHKELTDPNIRILPTEVPTEGVGIVEAPRGTLIHHYTTDEKGLIRKANLIVATTNNAARIAMSVEKAAKGLVTRDTISDGVLNMVEMAFRAYDPCNGCATHSLPGSMPLQIHVREADGSTAGILRRDLDGRITRR
jgi:F420-non-reducing hydrogenase large subunit